MTPTPRPATPRSRLATALKLLVVAGALLYLLVDWSSPRLDAADLPRPARLCARLLGGDAPGTPPLVAHLWHLLSPAERARLRDAAPPPPAPGDAARRSAAATRCAEALAEALNTLLVLPALGDPAVFAGVSLPARAPPPPDPGTPAGAAWEPHNRALLHAAFPEDIAPRAGPRLSLHDLRLRDGADAVWVLLLGALLVSLSVCLGHLRYWLLLRGLEVPLGLATAIRFGFIGSFFNTFLFGSVGGDVVKAAYVARASGGVAAAVTSVAVDRLLGLLSLLCLASVALLVGWSGQLQDSQIRDLALPIAVVATGLVGGFLAALYLLPPEGRLVRAVRRLPLGDQLVRLLAALQRFRHRLGRLLLCLGLTLFLQVVGICGLQCFALALDLTATPALVQTFVAAAPALLANALPTLGGGLGVGEAAFETALTMAGVAGGAAIFLTYRVVAILVGLIGLPLYLRGHRPVDLTPSAAARDAD